MRATFKRMMRTLPALAVTFMLGVLSGCGASSVPLSPIEGPGTTVVGDTDVVDDTASTDDTGLPAPSGSLEDPDIAQIDETAWMTRASLDLRGARPSVEELAQVTADPDSAAALVDAFVDDDRFGDRMAWLFNDTLHTAVWFDNSQYRFFPEMTPRTGRAAGWAPLALAAHLANEDASWAGLVTASQLPLNDASAEFWSVDSPGSGDTWVLSEPWDDRPMAGILSSSALWLAYDADRNNFNRRRANEVARIFLCADFFDRDVSLDFDLSPEALSELETAAANQPVCGTCHSALDPLAAFFGGFVERSANEPTSRLGQYSAWSARWYSAWTAPAYYGKPGRDLADLGAFIAADPRFARCTVRTIAGGLLDALPDDERVLHEWTSAFTQDGMVMRSLVREVVHSPWYRADVQRVLSTEQLTTALTDLLAWESAGEEDLVDLMWESEYRLLGGGTDDAQILVRNRELGIGNHLLMTWVARRVVGPTIEAEAGRSADTRALFTLVSPSAHDLSDAELRAQLVVLHTRMLSQPVASDSAEVDALVDLFEAAGGAADAEQAWGTVLHALLRHPRGVLF